MDSSNSGHPILSKRAVTYNTIPPRNRSDLSPSDSQPLTSRHSSDAILVSRHLSGLSTDVNASTCNGQLNQLKNGVSLGLEGYSSWLNLLLIFVPLGISASLLHMHAVYVFAFSFVGMIPLAMLLGKATEDIAVHTNQTLGALVNVTFGNAVELILCITALSAGKLDLVRNTIAGSVLSNLLLVLGSAFFFGGLRYREQEVLPAVSEANADLLSFAVFGFSIPALFAMALPESGRKAQAEERMSLVTSVCLLVIYGMYLLFQLYTHAELYEESTRTESGGRGDVESGAGEGQNGSAAGGGQRAGENMNVDEGSEESGEAVASLPVAMGILIGMVVLVALNSELLVDSIDGFSRRVGLGERFIAVVLLPVIGNAVEHMSAILVARHNKIDLSIGIACGSSVQIALFAAPVLVVVSWVVGYDHLTLNFELFETICLGFSVFVVNATLRDSRSNWLEGAVLVMCYLILATAFYFMG